MTTKLALPSEVSSLNSFKQFITPTIKQLIKDNKNITNNMLGQIVLILDSTNLRFECFRRKPTNKSKSRQARINTIYKLLFNSVVTDEAIDSIYNILGNKLLRYDDDEYCDQIIEKIDKYQNNNVNIYPLILIVNALIGKSLI